VLEGAPFAPRNFLEMLSAVAAGGAARSFRRMSNREIVINLIEKLPEDMPPQDIAREIELIAGVRKAREEAARGEGVSPEQARQLVDSWVSR
jgi:hypothetical protein